MSILATSPTAIRVMDMNISNALGSMEAALILQQLHYWMEKEGVGVKIDNAKYIYNTFEKWVREQFTFLSEWKFRKAMKILRSLEIVDVIRYKAPQWDQTNYYSLNYEKLREWAEAESIEISEMCNSSPQDANYLPHEMRDTSNSLYESKNITKNKTTKQNLSDREKETSSPVAAASPKSALEEEKSQSSRNHHSAKLTASNSQKRGKSEIKQTNPNEDTESPEVDFLVNKEWRSLLPLLDSIGVPINRTLKDLLKLYPSEKVESAIAIVNARKREQHIPNPSGYFVSALKGDWGSKSLVESEGDKPDGMASLREVDKGAVFRHWYDLARELGYCSGQEVRDGEQWVCLSGSWEKWEAAVNRGYSLEYLKKIIKRNNRN